MATDITVETDRPADRWRFWAGVTLAVQLGGLFVYPAFICGCHFHREAIPVGCLPLVWSVFTFGTYRSFGERVVAYVNIALGIFWLYFAWDSNIQYAFR